MRCHSEQEALFTQGLCALRTEYSVLPCYNAIKRRMKRSQSSYFFCECFWFIFPSFLGLLQHLLVEAGRNRMAPAIKLQAAFLAST